MKKWEFVTNVIKENPNFIKKASSYLGLGALVIGAVSCIIALSVALGSYLWSFKLAEDRLNLQIAELYNQNKVLYNGVTAVAGVVVTNIEKPSYETIKSHTVQIFDIMVQTETDFEGATGTGTIVKRDNGVDYILTNNHVVEGAKNGDRIVVILDVDKQVFIDAEVVATSQNSGVDLALIKCPSIAGKTPVERLGRVLPQDDVYSVGFYLGMQYVYSEGTVAATYFEYTMANLPCAPGCSGSGVYDRYGRLVGVVFAGNLVAGDDFKMFDTAKALIVPSYAVGLFLSQNGIELNG